MNWNVVGYQNNPVYNGNTWFLGVFHLMMVEKWYTFGRNRTLNFEFDLFLGQ